MKMTKSDLKAIVKECLVEILSEGIGSSLNNSSNFSYPVQQTNFSKQNVVPAVRQEARRPTPQLREAIKREAGGDRILESILADTARTTLASQIAHGDSNPIASNSSSARQGISQQEQVNGTPEQLFGEDVTSKWASLAFAESPTKR